MIFTILCKKLIYLYVEIFKQLRIFFLKSDIFRVLSHILQFSTKNFDILKKMSKFTFFSIMKFSRNFQNLHFCFQLWDSQEITIFPIFWIFRDTLGYAILQLFTKDYNNIYLQYRNIYGSTHPSQQSSHVSVASDAHRINPGPSPLFSFSHFSIAIIKSFWHSARHLENSN